MDDAVLGDRRSCDGEDGPVMGEGMSTARGDQEDEDEEDENASLSCPSSRMRSDRRPLAGA